MAPVPRSRTRPNIGMLKTAAATPNVQGDSTLNSSLNTNARTSGMEDNDEQTSQPGQECTPTSAELVQNARE